MKVRRFAFATAIVALGAAAVPIPGLADPATVITTHSVDDSFIESRLNWSGTEGTGFILLWKVIVIEDDFVLCGVVHYPNTAIRRQSKEVLRRSYVLIEGEQVMRDLRFVSVAKRRRDLDSSTANCANSGVEANAGKRIQVGWDAGRARM